MRRSILDVAAAAVVLAAAFSLLATATADWCHMPYERPMVEVELDQAQQHLDDAGFYGDDLQELEDAKRHLENALNLVEEGIHQHYPCPEVEEEYPDLGDDDDWPASQRRRR